MSILQRIFGNSRTTEQFVLVISQNVVNNFPIEKIFFIISLVITILYKHFSKLYN